MAGHRLPRAWECLWEAPGSPVGGNHSAQCQAGQGYQPCLACWAGEGGEPGRTFSCTWASLSYLQVHGEDQGTLHSLTLSLEPAAPSEPWVHVQTLHLSRNNSWGWGTAKRGETQIHWALCFVYVVSFYHHGKEEKIVLFYRGETGVNTTERGLLGFQPFPQNSVLGFPCHRHPIAPHAMETFHQFCFIFQPGARSHPSNPLSFVLTLGSVSHSHVFAAPTARKSQVPSRISIELLLICKATQRSTTPSRGS